MADTEYEIIHETETQRRERIARESSMFQWQKKRSRSRARNTTVRREILARANDACEVCGFAFTSILVIHHILPVKFGGNAARRNLIALCPNCHGLVHQYGRRTPRDKSVIAAQTKHLTGFGYTENQAKVLLLIASHKARVTLYGEVVPYERPAQLIRHVLVDDVQKVGELTTK